MKKRIPFPFNLLVDLAPLILLYLVQHFAGLKAAIFCSILTALSILTFKVVRKIPLGNFFVFSTVMVVLFGVLDLILPGVVFIKYESAVTNLISAAYFSISMIRNDPIILELSGRKNRAKPITPLTIRVFQILTGIWVVYFLVKAAVYFWTASHYDLEKNLIFRGTFGNLSLYLMIGLSMILGRFLGRYFRTREEKFAANRS